MVSVIVPVRNEAPYIETVLAAVVAQDYPAHRIEYLIADGASTDGTREAIERAASSHPSIRLIDNPKHFVSSGLNRALAEARGDVIVRMDGHWEYPRDYVSRVVALREETGASNAGGVIVPTGTTYVQRSICAALCSPVGVASAAMRGRPPADALQEVDTVNGGCWRRETLVAVGGFNEEMVRNQDDELSFRLRKAGGRIVQSWSIRFQYVVRDRLSKLFRQYLQYGYWKVRVLRKHPRQASVRHLVPTFLVLFLLGGGLASIFAPAVRPVVALGAAVYGVGVTVAAFLAAWPSELPLWPGVVAAFLAMHIGYGSGFLLGLAALVVGPSRIDPWFSKLTR